MMSAALTNRVAQAGKTERLAAWSYHPATQWEPVLCKHCGDSIVALVEFGDPIREPVADNRDTVKLTQLVMRQELPNYAAIVIQMADGSGHETPVCQDCLGEIEPDDLEAMFMADLDELARQMERDKLPVERRTAFLKAQESRIPISWERSR